MADNATQFETLRQILLQFIGAVQQSGIIESAVPVQVQPSADVAALVAAVESLTKRVTTLEAALSQTKDTAGFNKQDLEDAIASYLHMNDYMDADGVDAKVEDLLSEHDFSTSPRLKRMVQDAVDEADLEDAVKNALESMTLNRYLDLSDLASDIDGELDIESKVSDALDNMDLSDKLDIAPAVREHVDDALDSHDFSDALRNTLSDDAVVEALLKLLLERVNKTLMSEDRKKEE